MEKCTPCGHGNQAAEIESSILVELAAATAGPISICTTAKLLRLIMGPNVSDWALVVRATHRFRTALAPPAPSLIRWDWLWTAAGFAWCMMKGDPVMDASSSTEMLEAIPGIVISLHAHLHSAWRHFVFRRLDRFSSYEYVICSWLVGLASLGPKKQDFSCTETGGFCCALAPGSNQTAKQKKTFLGLNHHGITLTE